MSKVMLLWTFFIVNVLALEVFVGFLRTLVLVLSIILLVAYSADLLIKQSTLRDQRNKEYARKINEEKSKSKL